MTNAIVKPVFDESVRGLCTQEYPRHKKGCPNFGKSPKCPPTAPLFADVYDLTRPVIAVWNVFDLAAHVERMYAKHPAWSWRQLVNCLYWQGRARKCSKPKILHALADHGGMIAETIPEAMGVNVTATMESIGVELEWPPVTKAIQVALLAYPQETPEVKR